MGFLRGLLRLPASDHSTHTWHVSPPVDVFAYAFSWLWVAFPLAFVGNDRRLDYYAWFLFVIIVTDVHRHYGFPYIYLDRQVFTRHPIRFTLFPATLLIAWSLSPWLRATRSSIDAQAVAALATWLMVMAQLLRLDRPDGRQSPRVLTEALVPPLVVAAGMSSLAPFVGIDPTIPWFPAAVYASFVLESRARRGRLGAFFALTGLVASSGVWLASRDAAVQWRAIDLLNVATVIAAAWNIWHVYMQKYGILRLYNAKSASSDKVPGWIDRFLVLSWLPLYLVWLGPHYRDDLFGAFSRGRKVLTPLIDALEVVAPFVLGPAIAVVAVAIFAFLWHEWKVNRFANAPRLWMAAGTVALSSLFFFMHPIKAYLAYAFSHAVEYMVFVWAFQRRRYQNPRSHAPVLAALLRHPVLAYGGFTVGLGILFVVLKYWGRTVFPDEPQPYFLGIKTHIWLQYWTVYQSMAHFYFDGFLWKMRLPAVRASI